MLRALALAFVLVGTPARAQPHDAPAAILNDVRSISTAGVPGPLAVFGDRAFVLVAGRDDKTSLLPVAAGAEWGRGRVVALGHGGMIGDKALDHAGTKAFVGSAVGWLAGKPGASIGVLRNDAMMRTLTAAGFNARALAGPWHTTLRDHAAVVVDSHSIGPAERAALQTYIKNGGGLLTGGLGWGWLQLNPGRTIHDHPGNLLLREAGLAWCDGTLEPTAPDAFATGGTTPALHAAAAMQALDAALTAKSDLEPQAAKTLIAALRVIPADHPLQLRAAELLAGAGAIAPTQGRPLRARDGVARVLVSLQVELERRTPAELVRPHPAAADFPGALPADAPRLERRIDLDLSIPGWRSTGLYAPPGEIITIDGPDAMGCSVRIGCHTDHLWHHDRWSRVPDVSRQWPLASGRTQVASAFGGLIYIEVPRRASAAAAFTIAGAVESPRYILGTTTRDAWAQSRLAPAPWGELESGKVILSIPSESLRTLDDPEPLMQFWDRISDAHATLGTIPLAPDRPHRFVPDVQISAGYMHSGYPIMTHLDAVEHMIGLDHLKAGSWGLLHELGHNHQVGDWTFDGTGEVTCNLFALHAIDTICTPKPGDRGHGAVNTPPSLQKHLDAGAPFEKWKQDPFLALHMYVQLERVFGWETFKRVFAEYRELPRDERPRTDDEKRDQWLVRFSRACGRNLGPFFQAWGVPTSDAARDSITSLPAWMPEDWPK